jgi:hypothetical protein
MLIPWGNLLLPSTVVINGRAATKIIASVEMLELFLTGKLYQIQYGHWKIMKENVVYYISSSWIA